MERRGFLKFCAASAAAAGAPAVGPPCFLLTLRKPLKPTQLKTVSGASYEWKGGIGATRSVVAYSAICAHRLSYPTKDISFISFRSEKSARNRFANEIHAVGTLGGEMFGEFFDKFGFRLQLEHGDAARSAVAGTCLVQDLDNYCRQQVKC